MNSRAGVRDENIARAVEFIARAAQEGAELVVLPEFFNYEYFPQYRDYRYMDYAASEDGVTTARMREGARAHQVWVLPTRFEMERPWLYYDTEMLIDPEGEIA